MQNKNTWGAQKGKANQKQQLPKYSYICIHVTKNFDIKNNLLFRVCHAFS